MLVIQHYKKFKIVPENTTPLHFAAMAGNTEMIKRLIQIGAQFNKIRVNEMIYKLHWNENRLCSQFNVTMKKLFQKRKTLGSWIPRNIYQNH